MSSRLLRAAQVRSRYLRAKFHHTESLKRDVEVGLIKTEERLGTVTASGPQLIALSEALDCLEATQKAFRILMDRSEEKDHQNLWHRQRRPRYART